MSGPATDWVRLQDISCLRAWRVLALLAIHFNDKTGRCDPSQELLAVEAQCSVATIKRQLAWLVRNGFIKRRKRGGTGYGRQSDTYELNFARQGDLKAKIDALKQQRKAMHLSHGGGQQLTAVHEATAHSCANGNSSQLCTTNRKTQPEEGNRKRETAALEFHYHRWSKRQAAAAS